MNTWMLYDRPRVAVVGGGLGGLTLALALRQYGITATVYERASALREVGAAVALAANGTRLLERLGLGPAIAAVSVSPSELVYRRWSDGRRSAAHPIGLGQAYRTRFGAGFYGLHRADLLAVLARAWGPDRLRLGRAVTGLRDAGPALALVFADGSEAEADIVVGADGLWSVVREWVTDGGGPLYSGTSGFRGLVPLAAVPSLPDPDALQFWTGPGAHVLHYPVLGDRLNFLAVIDGPDHWPASMSTVPAADQELARRFAGWHPGVREMLAAVPQGPRWGLFGQPPLRRWRRGPVVLLGDAAHAMLPHPGQGATQTLEDAFVLAGCLASTAASGDYEAAIARYERLRRARTRAVQRSSWVTSDLLHLSDGAAAAARDASLLRFPERFGWIHGYDADAVLRSVSI